MKKTTLLFVGAALATLSSNAMAANTCLFAVNSNGDVWTLPMYTSNTSGESVGTPTLGMTAPLGQVTELFADFNGDGTSDYLVWNKTSVTEYIGGIPFAAPFGPGLTSSNGAFYGTVANLAGDVDGDGRADLIAWNQFNVYVERSVEVGGVWKFSAPELWGTASGGFAGTTENYVGDFNGDKVADLMAWDPTNIWVMFGSKSGSSITLGPAISQWSPSSLAFYGSVPGGGNVLSTGVSTSGVTYDVPFAWNASNAWYEPGGEANEVEETWSPIQGTVTNFSLDVNQDGYKDMVTIDNPGISVAFNPQGSNRYWYSDVYTTTVSFFGQVSTTGGTCGVGTIL